MSLRDEVVKLVDAGASADKMRPMFDEAAGGVIGRRGAGGRAGLVARRLAKQWGEGRPARLQFGDNKISMMTWRSDEHAADGIGGATSASCPAGRGA
jgi:hypothetical protein